MLESQLSQIGFATNESKVYVELLRLGPQAVSIVAKKTKLNRTTTYSILKSLLKKGVVSSYINSNVKYFVANDPNSLVGYFDRKCKSFEYYRSQLLSMIPQFRELNQEYDFQKPVVTYYEGIEGVKHVMYDALTALDEYRACLSLDKWFESGLRDFLIEYQRDLRLTEKRVPFIAITPDTDEVRAFFNVNYDEKTGTTKVLYISKMEYSQMFKSGMNIYNDKVSFISLDRGDEYGVIIKSKEIANMHKTLFDVACNGFESTLKMIKNKQKN